VLYNQKIAKPEETARHHVERSFYGNWAKGPDKTVVSQYIA